MAGQMRLGDKAAEAMAGRVEAAPGQEHAKDIICAVCSTPAFEAPVKTAICGHLFDKECLDGWLKDKSPDNRTCPVCRQVLPPGGAAYEEADRYMKAILAGLQVECPQDCEQPRAKRMRYDHLAAHIRACPMTPLVCDNAGCGMVVPRRDSEVHAAECGHALISCEQCKGQVRRNAARQHKDDDCPRRRFQCAFCKKKNLIHSNKEAHELECAGQVPFAWVADLRRKNKEQEEELRALRQQNRELQQKSGEELRAFRWESSEQQSKHINELKEFRKENKGFQEQVQAALCCRVKVYSMEKPFLDGEYTILPEQRNGCRVWRSCKDQHIYKGKCQRWIITRTREGMLGEVGSLSSAEKCCNPFPPVGVAWEFRSADKRTAAPGTLVTPVAA